ncbi:mannitol-1-phosphate 5-dehydrogenase [Paenibacillus illinoisensis]|uniref:mannitol-1-phosphate 5-dehydrogenase n=1 Tax=Paenibacillus illinoisensis TaxID=59845 RepID=UPI00203DF14C|nr:mannitol-1-phosphate 5-dehydrogenase [Paenibacillus illinoisensis]MCM3206113.1 mannitol-1-phosphate 5-dehydrogenase [Paenibacillus illinoisensis]
MKAVHFGAGNIGRGFIGHMLSASDYEVCFVARNPKKISMLQKRKEYPITLANAEQHTTMVSNVTAIHVGEQDRLAERIASADLITTAVGVSALEDIAEPIAKGIYLRMKNNNQAPLHIIACENAIGGSTRLKKRVYPFLDEQTRTKADRYISFPNAAVDRIVPAQDHKDPLQVTVEPFYEWVVHRPALLDGFKEIEGVHYVDSLEPYIERKMFTVNTGHCVAAYFGYLEGFKTIRQVMSNATLRAKVKQVMEETGAMLVKKHGFNPHKHSQYIHTILERFANPNLTDQVTRVGRSPLRKLSPYDRLVRPAMQASEFGIEIPHLTSAMAAAMLFDHEQDEEAMKLQHMIREDGVSAFIRERMGIPDEHLIHQHVVARYEELKGHKGSTILT